MQTALRRIRTHAAKGRPEIVCSMLSTLSQDISSSSPLLRKYSVVEDRLGMMDVDVSVTEAIAEEVEELATDADLLLPIALAQNGQFEQAW